MKYYFYKYLPGDYIHFLDQCKIEHEGLISAYFLGEFVDLFHVGKLFYQIISPTAGIIEVSGNDLCDKITYHSRSRTLHIPNNNLCSICMIGKCSGDLCSECENKGIYSPDNKYFYLNDIVSVKCSNDPSRRAKFRITGASLKYKPPGFINNYISPQSFLSWRYIEPDFPGIDNLISKYIDIYRKSEDDIFTQMDYYTRRVSFWNQHPTSMASELKIDKANLYHRLGTTSFPGISLCDRCVFNNCSECGIKNLIHEFKSNQKI